MTLPLQLFFEGWHCLLVGRVCYCPGCDGTF